jgi:hypothetical protein
MPGFPFPPAGPLDLGSPPSLVLRVAKTSPSALLDFASVLPRSSIPRCGSLFARSTLEPRVSCAWWTGYRAPPLRPVLPRRRRDLSSFPCFPLTACPGSQPRWIPIGTCRSPLGLLPSRPLALSALPEPPRTRFRGLSPRPAVSFSLCFAHPVATVHSGSLPSRRQGFGRVDSPTLVGSHGEAFARFLVCLRHDAPPSKSYSTR